MKKLLALFFIGTLTSCSVSQTTTDTEQTKKETLKQKKNNLQMEKLQPQLAQPMRRDTM